MKTLHLFFLLFVASFGVLAQVPADATAYDCNGNSKNIYATLATGKSVIVLHKGVDCSICRNSAAGWQTWAAANTNNVDVWGAITYTYSSRSFQPECPRTTNWKSTYNWNNIFTFADSSRRWYTGSSPKYYVYSAIDSSIVYQGSNSTTARNMALSQNTVGIDKALLAESNVFYSNGSVIMEDLPSELQAISIYNISGQLLKQINSIQSSEIIDVSDFKKGTYVIQFVSNEQKVSSKKILFH